MSKKFDRIVEMQMPILMLLPAIELMDEIDNHYEDHITSKAIEEDFKAIKIIVNECKKMLVSYIDDETGQYNITEVCAKLHAKLADAKIMHDAIFNPPTAQA